MLIANCQLNHRTGTETYTYDIANELSKSGHIPLVYSPKLGEIAFALRDKGITVVDDLDMIHESPDVIQGHHYIETVLASLYFPQAPVLFVCHDRLIWHSEPPVISRILRYIAVDYNCIDRLIENAIPKEKTLVFFNTVDLKKFKARIAPLPSNPRKALIFSNQANKSNFIEPIMTACLSLGISVDVIGSGVKAVSKTPEDVLGKYDVVFAIARCALEAMACGAAVIPCDTRGCGPLVTTQNVESLRMLNFGMKTLVNPITPAFIKKQLSAYDPVEAGKVTEWIRSNASLEELVKKYVALYKELIEEYQGVILSRPQGCQELQKDLFKEICRDLEKYLFEAKYHIPFEQKGNENVGIATRYGAVISKIMRKIGRKLWN